MTIPTPEDCPFPTQTSLYAASKVAGEAMIHSYCEGFGFESYIFRFVSILGERYTHGHVFDFYKQLLDHPDHLKVLGDGTQRKSYLHIQDCLEAILHVMKLGTAKTAKHRVQTYNLGTEEFVRVNDSIGLICTALGLKPKFEYTGGNQGWVGDNPFIFLDTEKIRATGWKSALTIEQGIARTRTGFIHFLEALERKVDLAANFDAPTWRALAQPQWNVAHSAEVHGHVFANGAVAPRRALHENPILIGKGDSGAVDLELGGVA